MKLQQLAILIVVLALAAFAVTLAPVVAPNAVFSRKVAPKLGLDIQGGARVVLEAETDKLPKGQSWNQDTRTAVLRTIDNRVNANGVGEPVITPKGDKQFVVEIPAVKNNQEIIEQLQKTAQLEFYYSPDWKTERNQLGRYSFEKSPDDSGENVTIFDTTVNKAFRDRFHINRALRQIIDAGAREPGKAQVTPLPPPLNTLSAAAGKDSYPLLPDDAKQLEGLAEELKGFDAFLSSARKEMDGSDLQPGAARGNFSPMGGALVELEFTPAGQEKFAQFTKDHTREVLMMYLDGRILMNPPRIEGPILNGKAQISPFSSLKDAKKLADYLNGGSLPVPLHIVQQQSIEATLGTEAVRQGFIAGLVGLAAIIVFMLWVYRLPGAVACVALLLYTLFTYAVFVLVPVTFTLPGIAGFILSVGMAVDANILIFERTKEELREGRALTPAIMAGFQRAFSAIFDSNMCTAVTSLLLYNFGTGSVRGFALTLLLGVALSMFTAITVTRTFLLLLVGHKGGRPDAATLHRWGGDRIWRPRLNVVATRLRWYLLSLAIIVPGVVFAVMGGFKTGIEFTGGAELTLKFTQPVTRTQVEKAIADQGIEEVKAQIAGENTVYAWVPRSEKKGEMSAPEASALVDKLAPTFPGIRLQGFERIGASISNELVNNARNSIVLSSLFIVFYLAFRFAIGGFVNGLKFGVSAIIAMLHDILVLIGMFCVLGYFFNWKVDSMFVTAALTVIGFSVHDTIIIFDRIRENLKTHSKKTSFDVVVTDSINETFARSVFTSGTVILTLLALLIFGGPVIRPLNAALLIGILSGTYSSIFNAAPLVVDWQKRFGRKGDVSLGVETRER